ncbi:MAG: enoyl-CoA hydratase [Gammaproteobacteria bacterium RIFCSPHIGHO2_12_FULL_43_28]|nr:MAG: enoyl-CoA hydratase [Gammaproteobacteria bacterium RIFCSPHIGHO2_12_FULL_43_28]
MDELENRTFDEIAVGDTASLTRTLTENDIKIFAIMSGDINPAHVDTEYAQSEMFKKVIGHGMWGGALISTVLGTLLPGPGTIYIGQTIRFKKPVAIGDTLAVKVTAIEKIPEKKRVIFTCECRNQHDEVVMEGQAEVIAPTKKIRRPKAELPEISLRRTRSLFAPYLEKAQKFNPLRAAVIYPVHEKIIRAVHDAALNKLMQPILIGPKQRIHLAAAAAGVDISAYEIIDTELSHAAMTKAIAMARKGEVGVIVRGGARREELLPLMLKENKGLLMDRCISNVIVLDVPTYKKALILTDTLVNANPNLETKRSITQNAIDFAHALGIEKPKVAILAGVDTINHSLQSTIDAAALCKMAERGQIDGGILDGPLTFDNVISIAVAKSKGIESPVIGDADILVVPNLETGSMLAKQLEYLAESRNAGLAIGGRVPVLMGHINDISLSTISCAFAMLNTDHQQNELRLKLKGEKYD